MQIFPEDSLSTLEFDKIRQMVEGFCESEIGREQAAGLSFHTDPEILEYLLDQVVEFAEIGERKLNFPSQGFISLKEEYDGLAIENMVFSEAQFARIRTALNATRQVYNFFDKHPEEFPSLRMLTQSATYDHSLLQRIDKVVDEFNEVRSNASQELLKIRNAQQRKRVQIDKVFQRIIGIYKKKKNTLADTTESVRNGRRVLAVMAEQKREIGGVTHDESEGGRIVYIEPDACMQINNELLELERGEKREIYRILRELTASFVPERETLNAYQQLLGSLDFIRAKAQLARRLGACKPKLRTQPFIKLIDAHHPILLMHNKPLKKKTIPMSIQLDREQRILVISGPNAGGKSVSLKTVGLCQLMMQAGMLVPASDQSEMGIFRSFFTDIGDSQSIEDELSTYSSRLSRMRHFLERGNDRTLFLIDEFGSGTDPQLGGAVAEAILDGLNERNSFGIVTTHYANLKVYADRHAHVFNGSMVYDERKLLPTYRLETGKPGSSYTFAIAGQSGLPKKVISAARSMVDSKSIEFESLLSKVKQDKQKLQEQLEKVEREDRKLKELMARFDKLNAELQEQQKQLKLERRQKQQDDLRLVEERVEQILKEIKSAGKSEEKAREIKRQLRAERENKYEEAKQLQKTLSEDKIEGEIEVGSSVRLIESERIGKVAELRKNQALVTFGQVQTRVKLKDLVLVMDEDKPKPKSTVTKVIGEREYVPAEIDLRGKTQKEAIEALELYLDTVLLQDMSEIRIVHGKGTGALRKAVHQLLRGYKQVSEVFHPQDQLGGDGVSIARLV